MASILAIIISFAINIDLRGTGIQEKDHHYHHKIIIFFHINVDSRRTVPVAWSHRDRGSPPFQLHITHQQ